MKILVVDDDENIRDVLLVSMEEAGHEVREAPDGERALAEFRVFQPDLVVLDVDMPGINGLEVCRRIRETSAVPVLFLSARDDDDDRIAGLEEGGDDYVTKPFNPREVVIRVRKMLARTQGPRPLSARQFEYYCGACTTCLKVPDEPCSNCSSEPPAEGWPRIEDSRYTYLGRVVGGRYLLDQFLGAGGMGSVYRVWSSSIKRHFACKILDTRNDEAGFGDEMLRRFQFEAEVMSQLHNPHVVAIYDTVQLSPVLFSFVMDYVSGRTLHSLLNRVGRIKPVAALEMMRQLANGLHEAHLAGLIHRDLKPANIMIEQLPASGFFLRILDFGIAHAVGVNDTSDGFRGTPLYASPEQCLGDPVDARSDIYSLGCVLFHCLSGKPPFDHGTPLKVMEGHVREIPPTLRSLGVDVPVALEQLIASLLSKDPAARPKSLAEVIRAIDDVMPAVRESPASKGAEMQLPMVDSVDDDVPSSIAASHHTSSELQSLILGYALPASESGKEGAIGPVALAPRGGCAVIQERGVGVHIVRVDDAGSHGICTNMGAEIVALAVDETLRVAASTVDGGVWIWERGQNASPRQVGKYDCTVGALCFSSENLVVGDTRGEVHQISLKNGSSQKIGSVAPIVALGYVPREEIALTGGVDGDVILMRLRTQVNVALAPMDAEVRSIAASEDGYVAAILSRTGAVRVVRASDGQPLFTLETDPEQVAALAFAPDGQLLGLGASDRTLMLWELKCRPPT